MSLSFCLTLFSPTFPYIPYKVPWHYLKFLLAFFQIPFCSSLYSYPFLSPALCNKKHSASHTLTMLLPAELQPCSSLAAVREKATCFGLCRTSARGNDWPGQARAWSQSPGWLQPPWETTDFCLFLCPLMGYLPSAWAVHFTMLWGMWLSLRLYLPVRFDWSRSMDLNDGSRGTDRQVNRLLQ